MKESQAETVSLFMTELGVMQYVAIGDRLGKLDNHKV
jgi:hypothetical protein